MGTRETTITDGTKLNLPLRAIWSILVVLAAGVVSVTWASFEMSAMRKSFDELAAQLKDNNAALVAIDKRLTVLEDMKDRLAAAEDRIQRTREDLLRHCARSGDTSKVGDLGGHKNSTDEILRY